jgi:hypothetical protein
VIVISTEPDEGFSGKLCNSCGSTAGILLAKAAPVAPIFGFLWFCLVVEEASFVLKMKTTSSCWYEGYILGGTPHAGNRWDEILTRAEPQQI